MSKTLRPGLILSWLLVAVCAVLGCSEPRKGPQPSDAAVAEKLIGVWWGRGECKGGEDFDELSRVRPERSSERAIEFTREGQVRLGGSAHTSWTVVKVEANALIVQLNGKAGRARRVRLVFVSPGRIKVEDPVDLISAFGP